MEVIVVNDGSTDGSESVAEAVATECPDVPTRVITTANRGVSAARNMGIKLARADYIAFLDGDDWWEANHLEILSALVGRHGDAGLFVAKVVKKSSDSSLSLSPGQFIKLYSKKMSIIHTSSCLIKKDLAQRLGGFPTENAARGEDIVFWIRAGSSGGAAFTNEATSYNDRSWSGVQQRRLVLPAAVYHLYPRLHEYPEGMRRDIRKIIRKNIVYSLIAGWPIDKSLIDLIIRDVSPHDKFFAKAVVGSQHLRVFDLLFLLRKIKNRTH
jgi:glycosyltransferase involved in cell wall biosynthesis